MELTVSTIYWAQLALMLALTVVNMMTAAIIRGSIKQLESRRNTLEQAIAEMGKLRAMATGYKGPIP